MGTAVGEFVPLDHQGVVAIVGQQARVLRQAAEILNLGERVAILVGQGAKLAAAEVEEVAPPPTRSWPTRTRASWPSS